MASPVLAATAVTNVATAGDPLSVNLPAGMSVGDLLLHFTRTPTGQNTSVPASTDSGPWTLFAQDTSDASDDLTQAYWAQVHGGEGATMQWDMGGSTKLASITARITGAADPTVRPPADSAVTIGTTANANPGLFTPSTPAGTFDFLWISFLGLDSETATFTQPAGYTTRVVANTGTAGAVSANCMIAIASKQSTAASEDPGAWTSSAPNAGFAAFTIAVYPTIPTVPNPNPLYLRRRGHRFLRMR